MLDEYALAQNSSLPVHFRNLCDPALLVSGASATKSSCINFEVTAGIFIYPSFRARWRSLSSCLYRQEYLSIHFATEPWGYCMQKYLCDDTNIHIHTTTAKHLTFVMFADSYLRANIEFRN